MRLPDELSEAHRRGPHGNCPLCGESLAAHAWATNPRRRYVVFRCAPLPAVKEQGAQGDGAA